MRLSLSRNKRNKKKRKTKMRLCLRKKRGPREDRWKRTLMRLTTDLQEAQFFARASSSAIRFACNLINLIKPKRLVTAARAPYAQERIKREETQESGRCHS